MPPAPSPQPGPKRGKGKGKNKGRRTAKADLPQKTCPVCGLPFSWRKKWERDWDNVVYCSERCRRAGKGG